MDFWRHRSSQSTEWEAIKISAKDCLSMVKYEQCKISYGKITKESKIFQENVLCAQNSCNLSSNPSAENNWKSITIKHSLKCLLYIESIIASSEYGLVLRNNFIAKTLTC